MNKIKTGLRDWKKKIAWISRLGCPSLYSGGKIGGKIDCLSKISNNIVQIIKTNHNNDIIENPSIDLKKLFNKSFYRQNLFYFLGYLPCKSTFLALIHLHLHLSSRNYTKTLRL